MQATNAQASAEDMTGGTPHSVGLFQSDGRATGTHARYLDQMISKRSRQMTQLSTSEIPGGFTEKTARVNGVTLNYATGGTGPAVVLLHGYPQTWDMWRKVMPALARQYTLIAADLRGSGRPEPPAARHHKTRLAENLHPP